MHLICNVVISIIVLCIYIYIYIIYIGLTIIKCNVLACFDNSKITGAFRPKVVYPVIAIILLEHYDFVVGALRLRDGFIATRLGAFWSWDIQAEGHSDYNPFVVGNLGLLSLESNKADFL